MQHAYFFLNCMILKKAWHWVVTPVIIDHSTRRNIREDLNLQHHPCKNIKVSQNWLWATSETDSVAVCCRLDCSAWELVCFVWSLRSSQWCCRIFRSVWGLRRVEQKVVTEQMYPCVLSSFRRGVNEIFTLLGC